MQLVFFEYSFLYQKLSDVKKNFEGNSENLVWDIFYKPV